MRGSVFGKSVGIILESARFIGLFFRFRCRLQGLGLGFEGLGLGCWS